MRMKKYRANYPSLWHTKGNFLKLRNDPPTQALKTGLLRSNRDHFNSDRDSSRWAEENKFEKCGKF